MCGGGVQNTTTSEQGGLHLYQLPRSIKFQTFTHAGFLRMNSIVAIGAKHHKVILPQGNIRIRYILRSQVNLMVNFLFLLLHVLDTISPVGTQEMMDVVI